MATRLVALDEGPDIPVDRAMVVVGRHPQCDARLDSIRISRRHCCMTQDNGDLIVRDLGSTNGIRINGQRVEMGRLRPGDELSIAHVRFRFDNGQEQELTQLASASSSDPNSDSHHPPFRGPAVAMDANPLAAAVREMLPAGVADRCRIQVIVKMDPDSDSEDSPDSCRPDSSP